MSLLVRRTLDLRSMLSAFSDAANVVIQHRELIYEMTLRELKDRYAGNALGALWAFASPLLILGANLFAFVFIFRMRLGSGDTGLGYTTYVMAALGPWIAIQDALGRAPAAIWGSANLVKQIVFPNEILPLKVTLASLPSLAVGLGIAVMLTFANGTASLFGLIVLLPLAVLAFLFVIAGLVYLLAAIGVFIRDLKDVMAVLLSIGMFVHPVFYVPGMVPRWLEIAFNISPLTPLIACFRDALIHGTMTGPWHWLGAGVLALLLFSFGWRVYRMLKPTFGNVL